MEEWKPGKQKVRAFDITLCYDKITQIIFWSFGRGYDETDSSLDRAAYGYPDAFRMRSIDDREKQSFNPNLTVGESQEQTQENTQQKVDTLKLPCDYDSPDCFAVELCGSEQPQGSDAPL